VNGYLDALLVTERDRPIAFLPGPREAVWAYIGTAFPQQSERLQHDAVRALAALRDALAGRRDADPLPLDAIAEAAAAVRRSGGQWPSPDVHGPRPQRMPDGLDVASWWGVCAVWQHLASERRAGGTSSAARDAAERAAGRLAILLLLWIGPPVCGVAADAPSASQLARAWRSFEKALARYAPLFLLPAPAPARFPPRPRCTGRLQLRLIESLRSGPEPRRQPAARSPDDEGPHAA
jgi:hypothetical protein